MSKKPLKFPPAGADTYTMPETINPTQEVTMPATITAAEAAAMVPGTIPAGSTVTVDGDDGRRSRVLGASLTAYRVETQGIRAFCGCDQAECTHYVERWVPFSLVHGRPAFVAPLVTFG